MISDKINDFLTSDNAKIEALVNSYPESVAVSKIAEFLGADVVSIRAAIENNTFGASWRKAGSARHGYFVPTAQFIRWYLNL